MHVLARKAVAAARQLRPHVWRLEEGTKRHVSLRRAPHCISMVLYQYGGGDGDGVVALTYLS